MADDAVQPADAGQGSAEATDSGLYDLDSVAPEMRDALEPHLKAIEANATKKFQEAADYRKGWAPYEELGIKDVPPETLQGLLGFLQVANDPEQFAEWWKAAGEEQGLFDQVQSQTDDFDFEDVDELSTDKIKELISEAVSENISPLQEKLQAQEQERQQAEANAEITQQLEQIRADNPNLPEGAEDAIVRLAFSYADEDPNPIEKGFADYQSLIGQGEKSLFEKKAGQPAPPEGPGAASTADEKITSFGDPRLKAMAMERMKNS